MAAGDACLHDRDRTNAVSFIIDPLGVAFPLTLGQFADATMTLDDASMTGGGSVSGSVSAAIAFWVPEPTPHGLDPVA
ncbi:MAG: hypothetical protein VB934_10810, partial [Polyangiaceae bacterium]